MKIVNFIHIGPGRSGTTYIYEALKHHNDIVLPIIKDLNFFNENYKKGIDWYHSKFDDVKSGKYGELSNKYFYNNKVAERIYNYNHDIKIITVLRNPYEFILSAYNYRKKSGELPPEISFIEAVSQQPDLLKNCEYERLLNPYINKWESDKLFIRLFEDFKNDQANFFDDLAKFLSIEKFSQLPEKKVNPSGKLRFGFLWKVANWSANKLRELEFYRIMNFAKHNSFIRKIVYKDKNREDDITENIFSNELIAQINSEIEKLEKLLNKDLGDWKK